ncbi:hypothetical protein AMC75_03300 [Staphylococcus carnosus]|nr:hypothetical protein AMC75_03300 [Staphylococcus carnosus]
MFFSPLTYLLLWVLFSLVFLIFTFLTLSALGRQTRFKLRLSITIVSFVLGIICFFGIFSNNSIEKEWSGMTKSKPSFSIPNPLKKIFGEHKTDDNKQEKNTTDNNEKTTTSTHSKSSDNHSPKSTDDYEARYRMLPKDFDPKADKGEATTKNTGKYKVGKDIKPGHYTITQRSHDMGTFEQDNQYDNYIFSNALSGDSKYIASKISTYLVDGQTVVIKGMKNVKFKPESTHPRTDLNTGVWIVGADVEPGNYTVRSASVYVANFIVKSPDKNEKIKINEVIGKDDEDAKKSLDVNLKKGDIILVQGSGTVKLKK